MASANGDRNLLFGILALQMDFISRDALVKAMNAWILDKARPLGEILLEQNALGTEPHALLEALVREHLKQHGGDAEKSLAAVSTVGSVRQELRQIADPDVQASLSHVRPAADPLATRPPSVGAPSAVGRRFRVLRPHAEGGLGAVFVAHDEELHREVALKEIQERHADHPESRARFLVEAEITGGLEHPGIVPVYGLGTYDDGRPFYAMRFIRGDSLKEAIEHFHKTEAKRRPAGERALELRKLLGRFVDVCDAIAYAHSRGVLHRDLKPGNVMLGKYGETLVVDWGLAKPLGRFEQTPDADEPALHPASASGSAETLPGRAIGTPGYMSPEQAAGRLEQIGPASDVYGLGAVLYTLLTRKAPFSDPDIGAVLRKVQQGEFPRPRQISGDVSPALEAVCLKAMALKPEARYATPRALASDIEHWLGDEPVSAYREPLRTRLARWGRRHKTLVTGATVLLLTTVVALTAGLILLGEKQDEIVRERNAALTARDDAKKEHHKAEQARDKAEAFNNFLINDLLAVAQLEVRGKDITLKKALDGAAQKIDKAFAGQPEVEASVRLAVGDTYRSLSLYQEADPHLRRALALRREYLGPEDPETLKAANSYAMLLIHWGKFAEAESLCRENLEVRRRVLGPEHPDTLWSLHIWAYWLQNQGKYAEAEQLDRECLEIRTRVLGPEDRETLLTAHNLTQVVWDQDRVEEAEKMLRHYLEIRRRVLGPEDPQTLYSINDLALLLQGQNKLDEAEKTYREDLEISRRVFGPDHRETLTTTDNLASLLHDRGKLDEAEQLYRRVVEGRRQVFGPDHADALASQDSLASVLSDEGKYDEAEKLYRQTLETRQRVLGREDPNTLLSMDNLADLLQDRCALDEAERIYREELAIQRKTLPAGDVGLGPTLNLLSGVLIKKHAAKEAEPLLRECLEIRQKGLPKGDWRISNTESLLGGCLSAQGKYAEAEPLLLGSYDILKTAEGAPADRVTQALDRIVKLYEAWDKPEQAATWRAKHAQPAQVPDK